MGRRFIDWLFCLIGGILVKVDREHSGSDTIRYLQSGGTYHGKKD